MEDRFREILLNGLLGALVLLSLVLSSKIWFPIEWVGLSGSWEPQVQSVLSDDDGVQSDLVRPELVYVHKGGQVALVLAGSDLYREMWPRLRHLLLSVRLSEIASNEDSATPAPVRDDFITLWLPVTQPLNVWVQRWRWMEHSFSKVPAAEVDQITIPLAQTSSAYAAGPSAGSYRLSLEEPIDAQLLAAVVDLVPADKFSHYRRLAASGSRGIDMSSQVFVPTVDEIPIGDVAVSPPSSVDEKVRYFPDMSVVRQIDELGAQTFTDGKRLLRLSDTGFLEYRSADESGEAPSLVQALAVAQAWVDARGGWPDDVVLTRYIQAATYTKLIFEARLPGPYPVESVDGFVQTMVAVGHGGERVTSIVRPPGLTPIFGTKTEPIRSPEEALRLAAQAYPTPFAEMPVREMHLAYLLRQGPQILGTWKLEPSWVVRLSHERIYVPARGRSTAQPILVGSGEK